MRGVRGREEGDKGKGGRWLGKVGGGGDMIIT